MEDNKIWLGGFPWVSGVYQTKTNGEVGCSYFSSDKTCWGIQCKTAESARNNKNSIGTQDKLWRELGSDTGVGRGETALKLEQLDMKMYLTKDVEKMLQDLTKEMLKLKERVDNVEKGAAEEAKPLPKYILLTPAEVQSGVTRVLWAESLIRQLPQNHEGRRSWLLNYGERNLPRSQLRTRAELLEEALK